MTIARTAGLMVHIRGAESQGGSLTCRNQGDVDGSRSHRRFDTAVVVVVAAVVVVAVVAAVVVVSVVMGDGGEDSVYWCVLVG